MVVLTLYLFVSCLVAIAVIVFGLIALSRRATRQHGKSCLLVGASALSICFVALLAGMVIQTNSEARARGFVDFSDSQRAKAAGVEDAGIWHKRLATAEEKKAQALALQRLEVARQLEEATRQRAAAAALEDAARHKFEKEEVARKAAAEVEQKRHEADRLLHQKQAAETAAKQVEKDRLQDADAERAVRRYRELQDRYVASAARSIQLLVGSVKDPSSAAIRDVRESHLPGGQIAVCGLINGRNSFGAMTGFRRFVAVGDLNVAEVEGDFDNSAFQSAWANYCFE